MTVFALDLDLRQRCAGHVAIAMHIHGGMAILAEHAARRVAIARLDLMVQVVLDEEVILGVQLGLLATSFVIGRAIGEFHDPLITHTNPLAAVMTA